MADRSKKSECNEGCGCPVPCPGGNTCKCEAGRAPGGGASAFVHAKDCPCGDRCTCNPCKCNDAERVTENYEFTRKRNPRFIYIEI
uniref:Metallothionein n=1 Tax=Kalanchoe fedtschenkoi TaxID=63787 RepID=A0A7N0UNF3_KALFE